VDEIFHQLGCETSFGLIILASLKKCLNDTLLRDTIIPDRNPSDEDIEDDFSKGLLHSIPSLPELCSFSGENCVDENVEISFDEFVLISTRVSPILIDSLQLLALLCTAREAFAAQLRNNTLSLSQKVESSSEGMVELPASPLFIEERIESAVAKMLHLTTQPFIDEGVVWVPTYRKNGLSVCRCRYGGMDCVRGEMVFPFSIQTILALISREEKRPQWDLLIEESPGVHWLSSQNCIEYLRYKAVWPASPRDFCNFIHWRLLPSGVFVKVAFSEESEIYPVRPGIVRANMKLAGFVMQPVPTGTKVYLILQVVNCCIRK
jgi:hypothetical protein